MDFSKMTIEEIETRRAQIATEVEAEGADTEALLEEVRGLNAELETRRNAEARRNDVRAAVAAGAGKVTKTFKTEETKSADEIRNSKAYIDAYANYIKTGDDRECRSLLTENISGGVPVPVMVDEIVRTAWENDEIVSRVRRTFFRGNLKVPFEISADAAYVHTEGTAAITEEDLTLGIVNMVPATIKKFVRISDEAVAMGGEAFLRYVYDELTYQIVKKLAGEVVNDIATATPEGSSSKPAVPAVALAPSVTAVATGISQLSAEARPAETVAIMNKLTYASFIEAQAAANFAIDPFYGATVIFTNALPAYSAANEGDVYLIVGDLDGCQCNYPEGDGVAIKYDDLTEAAADIVRIVGRQYVAHALTAPGRFCNVKKPTSTVTT